jgi:hypothetical protein
MAENIFNKIIRFCVSHGFTLCGIIMVFIGSSSLGYFVAADSLMGLGVCLLCVLFGGILIDIQELFHVSSKLDRLHDLIETRTRKD